MADLGASGASNAAAGSGASSASNAATTGSGDSGASNATAGSDAADASSAAAVSDAADASSAAAGSNAAATSSGASGASNGAAGSGGSGDPLSAADDSANTGENAAVTIDVLANDSGDGMSVSGVAVGCELGGTVTVNADNTITFDPGTDYDVILDGETIDVEITYTVTDADGNSTDAVLTVSVMGADDGATILGTNKKDTLNGTAGDDVIDGLQNNDTINADDGADVVYGNNGSDTLNGGDGNDIVFGEEGQDELNGDAGDDHLFGGEGIDTLNGGGGIAAAIDNWRHLTVRGPGVDLEKKARLESAKGHAEEMAAFVAAIRSGIPAIPFEDQKETTLATFAIQRSLRTGQPQTIAFTNDAEQ